MTPSVVPVWLTWFNGGAGMQNFSGRFGADFTADATTVSVSSLLSADIAANLDATQVQTLAATATPGAPVSLLPALPGGYATAKTHSLETDGDPMLMDFTTIGSAPGTSPAASARRRRRARSARPRAPPTTRASSAT